MGGELKEAFTAAEDANTGARRAAPGSMGNEQISGLKTSEDAY